MDQHSPTADETARTHRGGWGRIVLVILILVAVAGAYFAGRGSLPFMGGRATGKKATMYHCPMHPTIVQDKKGTCPVCMMDLVPVGGQHSTTPSSQHSVPQYHCPMHPTVVSDKPGDCPICGMKLVPTKPEGDTATTSSVAGLATVSITPEIRQRMGLTVGAIEKRSLSREVRTSARIVADETRLHHVTVKTEGWIGQLFVAVTGQAVKRGDPLLTLYSPELVSAQEEYLIALKAKATPGGDTLLAATRRKLELWDVTAEQMRELEKTGQAQKFVTVYAHVSGAMLDKQVFAGHKVMPNEPLMTIADLSTVWADADIYQSDLPYVKVGLPVTVTVASQTVTGKVSFVSPSLDPATRTMKARLEIPNPDLFLKPEMYANARLAYPLGDVLAIPEAAVMRTGERTYAFKDGGDGKLIPVEIKVGPRSDGWFQLREGLAEGDKVVTSANFLVDSESSLKAALNAMAGGHKH